jgi:hypothetical protein
MSLALPAPGPGRPRLSLCRAPDPEPPPFELSIPTLDLAWQATAVAAPVAMWGAGSTRRAMPGTWHFYTVDRNINGVWRDPDRLPATGCAAAIEPNFSIWTDDPYERAWWMIFRKRALACRWGERGVKIIVDLNVNEAFADLMLLGVPCGWRAYATRLHFRTTLDELDAQYSRACVHAGTEEILFVVYSGGPRDAWYCAERGWVHIPNHWQVVTGEAEPYGRPTEESGRWQTGRGRRRCLPGLRWR